MIAKVNLFIDCALVDDHSLVRILVGVNNTAITELVRLLRPHQVRDLAQALFGDLLHLHRWQILWIFDRRFSLIIGNLLRGQGCFVLEHLEFHLYQPQILEANENGLLDLTHVKLPLHLLILVILQHG